MNDDRPLHVLAARCAFLFGVPLLNAEPKYPADPKLRAIRIDGVPVDEAHKDTCPVWLEFGRGLRGGKMWELIAVSNGGKSQRVLVIGRTPKAFREAFDAAERAIEGIEALRLEREERE